MRGAIAAVAVGSIFALASLVSWPVPGNAVEDEAAALGVPPAARLDRGEPEKPPATAAEHRAADSLRAGNSAYARDDFTAAAKHFADAVAASPDHAEARNNLAQVLIRRGEAAAALPHLDAAVRQAPDRWSYRFNRARAFSELGRWQDAAAEYDYAVRLFPDDHATHFNRGLVLIQIRRFDEAVRALETARGLEPDDVEMLIPLGTALVGAQQAGRARAIFEEFLARAPKHGEAERVRTLLTALPPP